MERTDARTHAKGLRTFIEWQPTQGGDEIDVTCIEVTLPSSRQQVVKAYPSNGDMLWLLVALDQLGYSYYKALAFVEEYLETGHKQDIFLKRIDAIPSTEDGCEWDGSCQCGPCPECGHPCSSSCCC